MVNIAMALHSHASAGHSGDRRGRGMELPGTARALNCLGTAKHYTVVQRLCEEQLSKGIARLRGAMAKQGKART